MEFLTDRLDMLAPGGWDCFLSDHTCGENFVQLLGASFKLRADRGAPLLPTGCEGIAELGIEALLLVLRFSVCSAGGPVLGLLKYAMGF